MTFDEKLVFVKKHLTKKVRFLDGESENDLILIGLSARGLFLDENLVPWPDCEAIANENFIPWTIKTAEKVKLKKKSSGKIMWVQYDLAFAWVLLKSRVVIPYSELFTDWETVDGRPCGSIKAIDAP